jgi:hypothetical protein
VPDVTVCIRHRIPIDLCHIISPTMISRGLDRYASSVFVEESDVILAEMFSA